MPLPVLPACRSDFTTAGQGHPTDFYMYVTADPNGPPCSGAGNVLAYAVSCGYEVGRCGVAAGEPALGQAGLLSLAHLRSLLGPG